MADLSQINIRATLAHIRPGSEYQWLGDGDFGNQYDAIGEWRDPETTKPTEQEIIDGWPLVDQRGEWERWREAEYGKNWPIPINPQIVLPTFDDVWREYYFRLSTSLDQQLRFDIIEPTDKKNVFDVDGQKYEVTVSNLAPVLAEYTQHIEQIQAQYLEGLSETNNGNVFPPPST